MYAQADYINMTGLGSLNFTILNTSALTVEETSYGYRIKGDVYASISNPAIDVSAIFGTTQTITLDITGDFYDYIEPGTYAYADGYWFLPFVAPDGYRSALGYYSSSTTVENRNSFMRVTSLNRFERYSVTTADYFLWASVSIPLTRLASGKIELIGRHNAIVHYGNNAEHVTRASGGIWYGTGGGSVQKMQLEQGNFGYLWINGQKRRVQLNAQTLGFYE